MLPFFVILKKEKGVNDQPIYVLITFIRGQKGRKWVEWIVYNILTFYDFLACIDFFEN